MSLQTHALLHLTISSFWGMVICLPQMGTFVLLLVFFLSAVNFSVSMGQDTRGLAPPGRRMA